MTLKGHYLSHGLLGRGQPAEGESSTQGEREREKREEKKRSFSFNRCKAKPKYFPVGGCRGAICQIHFTSQLNLRWHLITARCLEATPRSIARRLAGNKQTAGGELQVSSAGQRRRGRGERRVGAAVATWLPQDCWGGESRVSAVWVVSVGGSRYQHPYGSSWR